MQVDEFIYEYTLIPIKYVHRYIYRYIYVSVHMCTWSCIHTHI